ncbi:TIGR02679 family protein [Actinoalloteichus sp. AHMU CJ021]|uniref:TIGR02679 family protein n=1 Tax=Actinoalloteichus sp. AHMU CJ021 TaxID=2072503 RepID=UPI000CA0323C|nr:TIGR02679 family protein [Actinoalloteichus sp. AHMU CJ021]
MIERASVVAASERAWRAAFTPLDEVVRHRPELTAWHANLRDTGLVRRITGSPEDARPLLADLAAVLRHLPATGEPLGTFAARITHHAHALDDGRPLSTLTLGAARALSGLPEGKGAEWRRQVWASVGLWRDDLSSTVLTLGLAGDERTSTGRALAAWREAGQPVVLTLRQLVRDPPRLTAAAVAVCENPVVVSSAADQLGAACRPLICVNGQPGAAVLHLLRLLVDAGTTLTYHGDFDWGGIRIANSLFDRFPVRPWRFDAGSYHAAAAAHGRPLTGTAVPAAWDGGLTEAMRDHGKAVEEELLLDDLLDDLRE